MVMVSEISDYTKNHEIVHFKRVNYTSMQLNLVVDLKAKSKMHLFGGF